MGTNSSSNITYTPIVERQSVRSGLPETEIESRKISSGIPSLDRLIEGGFYEGDVILVAGQPGAGKTILGMQFLCSNAMHHGQAGTFVTFVENGKKLRRNFGRFSWNLRELEKKGLLSILDLIQSTKSKGIEANFNFIMDQSQLTGSKTLVIDSLNAMMVSLLGNKAEARSYAGLTKNFLDTTGCTTLLIQELPWARDDFGLGFEEFLVDGVIALDTTVGSTRVRRQLFIPKMRGVDHSLDLFDYRITSEGITVAPLPLSNK